MKKYLFSILVISLVALPVLAATELVSPPDSINIVGVFKAIGTLLMSIAIPIAIIMVIVAGFYFMTAQGDPGKIDTAKKMLLWTLIGTAVVLMAEGVVVMVERIIRSA